MTEHKDPTPFLCIQKKEDGTLSLGLHPKLLMKKLTPGTFLWLKKKPVWKLHHAILYMYGFEASQNDDENVRLVFGDSALRMAHQHAISSYNDKKLNLKPLNIPEKYEGIYLNYEVEPEEFIKWATNIDGFSAFPGLPTEGTSAETKKEESKNRKIPNNKKITRKSEIHECIGIVVRDLKIKNSRNPSGAEAWKEFKKRGDDFDCVTSIEFDKKEDEDVISWISVRAQPQKMRKSTFLNVVSQFNSGKKPLPD